MLGNCEKKMTATNQWALPQDQIVDGQKTFIASTSKRKVMEKTSLQDNQRQLPPKCPRCDSSNTKFCYYNNYSLSQPRHFCKACKRYWTRGGTLRNVPVGGGCRKNKRMKRPSTQPSNGGEGTSTANSTAATSPSVPKQIDLSSDPNHINNSMFYSLPNNYPGLNFPFSRFSSPTVTSDSNGFDFQLSQINGHGLGFVQNYEYKDDYKPVKKMEDLISISNTSVAIDPIFFGSSTFSASTSTMATLLASSLQHQNSITNGSKEVTPAGSNNFPGLLPFDGMQIPHENGMKEKEYKIEGQNRLDWNLYPVDQQIDHSTDSAASLLWNTSIACSWFDPSNVGSSVPSLI